MTTMTANTAAPETSAPPAWPDFVLAGDWLFEGRNLDVIRARLKGKLRYWSVNGVVVYHRSDVEAIGRKRHWKRAK